MNELTDQPSYNDIPIKQQTIQLTPYTCSREYTVERSKRSLHECYVSLSGEIVADRKFVNLTTLKDVYILDGATQSRIFSGSRGTYNHDHTFRIIASISPIAEIKNYLGPGNPANNQTRDTVEFVITEQTLRKGPVYIPELNIKVVAGQAVYTETVPNVLNEMNVYKEYIQQQAQKYYDKPAYAPYMLLPQSYKGSKEFYLAVNNSICLLPILIVDDTIVAKPRFVLKWRDGIDSLVKDIDLEIDPVKLLKDPILQIEDKTYVLSTNKQLVKSILEDQVANANHQEIVTTHLKNQIQTLTQDKKLLEEEIIRLKADREVSKYYSGLEHDRHMQASKEKLQDKKDTGETLKIIGATVTGVVALAGLIIKIVQMTSDKN